MIKSVFIYAATFAISILFSSQYSRTSNKLFRSIILLLSIAMPVFISTFRYGVGIDFFSYRDVYRYIINQCTSIRAILAFYQEPLYVVLNLIAHVIFDDYIGVLLLSSLLFMFFSFRGIIQFEEKLSIPLAYFIFLIVLFSPSFNGVRQFIAVAIFFNSYKYIYNRNFKKYILLVVFASLFHKSALFLIPLYFVWSDKGNKPRIYYFLLVLFIFMTPLLPPVISKLFLKFGIYNHYFELNKAGTYGFLLYILPILVVFLVLKHFHLKNGLLSFLLRLYLLQIPLQLIGNNIAYADRLALYLAPSQVILFPYYLSLLKNNRVIVKVGIIAWYLFYYVVMFIVLNSNGVYPYIFKF